MRIHTCHIQSNVLIEIGLKIEAAAETLQITDFQNRILIIVIKRSIEFKLLRTGINGHIMIMNKTGTRNFVHMVVSLCIAYLFSRKRFRPSRCRSRFRPVREEIATIKKILHSGKVDISHILLSIKHIIVLLDTLHGKRAIVRNTRLPGLTFLSCNQNHTISGRRTVNGSCTGILHHVDGKDVIGVQCSERTPVGSIVQARQIRTSAGSLVSCTAYHHTVDDIKRRVRTVGRKFSTNVHTHSRTGLCRVLRNGKAGHLALQQIVGTHRIGRFKLLGLYGRDGTRHRALQL